MEGNCEPSVSNITCRHCPSKRTVKIFEYALIYNAAPDSNSSSFFDSFNTPLIAEVNTDKEGFFQVSLPAGRYSIAVVENGKLYANAFDGYGGINPVTILNEAQKTNLMMSYRASF
jgi:hypothetical protein